MRVLIAAVVCGLLEELRGTLPSTEDEAGAFVAGMTYAFVLFWSFLIAATWLWAVTR